jgi:hypothetical protein
MKSNSFVEGSRLYLSQSRLTCVSNVSPISILSHKLDPGIYPEIVWKKLERFPEVMRFILLFLPFLWLSESVDSEVSDYLKPGSCRGLWRLYLCSHYSSGIDFLLFFCQERQIIGKMLWPESSFKISRT